MTFMNVFLALQEAGKFKGKEAIPGKGPHAVPSHGREAQARR